MGNSTHHYAYHPERCCHSGLLAANVLSFAMGNPHPHCSGLAPLRALLAADSCKPREPLSAAHAESVWVLPLPLLSSAAKPGPVARAALMPSPALEPPAQPPPLAPLAKGASSAVPCPMASPGVSQATHPSTMESPRMSLRFLKKDKEMSAAECLIFRKPVMVSISPRLPCSSVARFSARGRGSHEPGGGGATPRPAAPGWPLAEGTPLLASGLGHQKP